MTRINYTGRQRIAREAVRLRVRSMPAAPVLDVLSLGLDSVRVPAEAEVVVEAYRQTAYMRFYAGTVANPVLFTDELLYQFDAPESIRFRVKVVGTGEQRGKVLAQADQIRAALEDAETPPQTSLLVIAPKPLGQILWRLEFNNDEPELMVNSDVGDWKTFAATPAFQAFVLPEVLRQIASWVLTEVKSMDDDDESVLALWVKFFGTIGYDPKEVDDSDESKKNWIEDVVAYFGRAHRFRDLVRDLTGEVEE